MYRNFYQGKIKSLITSVFVCSLILFIAILPSRLFALANITSFTPTSAGTGQTVTINGAGFTSAGSVNFGGTLAASYSVISDTKITAVVGTGTSGSVTVFDALGIPGSLAGFTFATPPTISYASPQTYTLNTLISTLVPTSSGVAAPGYSSASTFSTLLFVPWGLATDAAGNVYASNVLSGIVEIPAGGGSPVTLSAGFIGPRGIAVDAAGNVYVADYGANTVSKIPAGGGSATTLGTGFNGPTAVAVDAAGNVYVSDSGNNAIKEILASDGSTISIGSGFSGPTGLAVDAQGNVYVADFGNNAIKEINASSGSTTTLYTGLSADNGIVVDASGNIFYSSGALQTVNEIPAGSSTPVVLASGITVPHGIAVDPSDNVFYDTGLLFINEVKPWGGFYINAPLPAGLSFNSTTGAVSGTPTVLSPATNYTVTAYNNGNGTSATVNIKVKNVSPSITSFSPATAGPGAAIIITGVGFTGTSGVSFGSVAAASFKVISDTRISAIVASGSASGNVSVTNPSGTGSLGGFTFVAPPAISYSGPQTYATNAAISPLTPANSGGAVPAKIYGQVTLLAGSGTASSSDGTGTGASFNHPDGIAIDAAGNAFVSDRNSFEIRKVTSGGVVTTFVGGGLSYPTGMAFDPSGNLYLADQAANIIRKITPAGAVSVFAGSGAASAINATGAAATFNSPASVVSDAAGNIYVADYLNFLIRKITPAGVVTTFAGNGAQATVDGTGTSASFGSPSGITMDAQGNLYVSDEYTDYIRKITPAGVVTTIAGSGPGAYTDGPAATAKFHLPEGIVTDPAGNIYIADEFNNAIRKLSPSGIVSTVANGFNHPIGLANDGLGNLYFADFLNNQVKTVNITGYTISPALPAGLSFDGTTGIISGIPTAASPATDYTITANNLAGFSTTIVNLKVVIPVPVVASFSPATVGTGETVTIIGSGFTGATAVQFGGTAAASFSVISDTEITAILAGGASGSINITTAGGTGSLAAFTFITAPAISYASPQTYFTNNTITPLAPANAGGAVPGNVYSQVSTFAGTGSSGNANGTGTAASFNAAVHLATDAAGNIYVADQGNNLIREITSAGVVTTLAGSGALGAANGTGTAASFNHPTGIAVDAFGNVYVADGGNNLIRKIAPGGVVTTFAGSGAASSLDGTGTAASFHIPYGLATDAAGNVYVAEYAGDVIRKITPAGVVTTLAGSGVSGSANGTGTAASFSVPVGLAVDAAGNVYVADSNNELLRKITPAGAVTTLAGTLGSFGSADGTGIAASFFGLLGLTIDAQGNIYVADVGNNRIRKVTPAGVVTTFAGSNYAYADGIGIAAKFRNPSGVAMDANGNLYVSDQGNFLIRKVLTTGYSFSPALPAGLTFDYTSGTINGTPTATSPATDYTVSGYNLVGSSTTTVNITVKIPVPTIASFSPTIAGIGETVTIAGTGFTGATAVTFGGTAAASFTVVSDSQITAVLAGGASGSISITTPSGTGSLTGFTFISLPAISYTSPQVFTQNTTISPLIPVNSGGTVPPNIYGQVSTIITSAMGFNIVTVVTDPAGNLYMADQTNNVIRKMDKLGNLSIFAGSGLKATTDGTGTGASFNWPAGLVMDPQGNIYVSERAGNTIRKLTPAGVVTTFAGSGVFGATNGTGTAATFNSPRGLAMDLSGNIYVGDLGNNLIRKITPGAVVTTMAGGGVGVATNGTGTTASFNGPLSVATDAAGNVYVADSNDNMIRKITPLGVVSTFAGKITPGSANGTGTSATFNTPYGVVSDALGNLYVADYGNNLIREITPSQVVTTVAGNGAASSIDGTTTTASFDNPIRLYYDVSGVLYVADFSSGAVRKIGMTGYTISPALPTGLSFDGTTGTITGTPTAASAATDYTVTAFNLEGNSSAIVNISVQALPIINSFAPATAGPGERVTITGSNFTGATAVSFGGTAAASFTVVSDIEITAVVAAGSSGNISITTPAGTGNVAGFTFTTPPSITYTSPQTYSLNKAIVPLVPANGGGAVPATIYGQVNTFAGSGTAALTDGTGTGASFNNPFSATVDYSGNIYEADGGNNAIREITQAGVVTTLAGGSLGSSNGTGAAAKFNAPLGVATDAAGNVYVADYNNSRIRMITPAGVVTTFAGGVNGYLDATGTAAKFNLPRGIASDAQGNIYVADYANNMVRMITPAGVVTTLAGQLTHGNVNATGTAASFWGPIGLAVDPSGNVYVADDFNNLIRKITPAGVVTTFAGSGANASTDGIGTAAGFSSPSGLTIDASGNLYVTQAGIGTGLIRKITPAGVVTTVPGGSLSLPDGVVYDGAGNLYVANTLTNLISKIPVTGFTISPALPAGLSFDGTTGTISGTPTTTSPATDYTVTAYNLVGSNTTTVNIAVPPAPVIGYATPQTYAANVTITPLAPTATGVAAQEYGNPVSIGTGFNSTEGVAVDATGNVYVADRNNNQIKKILASDGTTTVIGSGFTEPLGIAVDVAGNVYVADFTLSSITEILASDGSTVNLGSGISGATGVAVDAGGNVYVATANTVYKLPAGGAPKIKIGLGGFNARDLTVDLAGNIYVAGFTPGDPATGVIFEITASTNAVIPLYFYSGNSFPGRIAIDGGGNLYVANDGVTGSNTIQVLPAGSSAPNTLATVPGALDGLAIDGKGNIYYSDGVNSVYEISPLGGYYISPLLPAGLNLDNTSGVISGTPTKGSPATDYTVTAYNAGGSGTATLNITVTPPPYDATGIVYVNQAVADPGDGSSWASPLKELRDAATIAANDNNVHQIWVAKGTYMPTAGPDRTVAFNFDGVAVYGGFNGTETTVASRNIAANPTILSGDIGETGSAFDNSYNVIDMTSTVNPTTIDGFTITGANNNSGYSGGGLEINGTTATITLNQLTINNNTALLGAGADIEYATVNITNSVISNNTSNGGDAGGMEIYQSTVVLNNTVFDGDIVQNTTEVPSYAEGGAMEVDGASSATTVTCNNCVFNNNQAINASSPAGAAIINYGGTLNLTNCTFYNNSLSNQTGFGNTIDNESYDDIINNNFVNTIIWGTPAPAIANSQQSFTINNVYTNSDIQGLGLTSPNLDKDPLFVNPSNPVGADGIWGTADDGLQVSCLSPAHNTGTTSGGTTADITGTTRVSTPDMGAYQQTGAPVAPSVSIVVSSGGNCPGVPLTFTATPTNGGTNPSYQWIVNANPLGSNSNSFSVASLNAGDLVTCILTPDNSVCVNTATATSNTITINSLPQITASAITTVNAGSPYLSQQIAATGGVAPYTFTVSAGTLPNGITLNSDGTLTGTSNIPGTYQFTAKVTESGCNNTATQVFSADINGLSNLTLTTGVLSPLFDPATTTYVMTVPNATSAISFTPTAGNQNVMIKINGTAVLSGLPSPLLPLSVGSNTITIKETAQDLVTVNTYTITITRASSSVATLNNLAVSSGTLTPGFTSGNTTYTDDVTNGTTSITVTPTLTDNTATVKVNGASVNTGTPSGAIPLNIGPNTITTIVTAQDGSTTDTYTITVNRAASAIATLNNLTISSGTLSPVFASGSTSYTDNVANTVTSVTVTPTVTNGAATIKVNGTTVASGSASAPTSLTVGANTITTIVTAQDGTTTGTYTITVNRAPSAIATLSNLTISSGTLSPVFASGSTSYTDNVSNTVASVTVTPTVTDGTATIKVNGTTVASGSASAPISLTVGANTITTIVTAQDGTTTSTYTITVNRAPSAIATLSNLTISSGTLTPVFSSTGFGYAASVSNATASITLTPTFTDVNSTITVNGTTVASGSASGAITLNAGTNTITTVVTAQDGVTTKTYTVTVTRAASAVATLNNLTISSGTLTPTFASGTTSYTDAVSNATTSVTVTPTVTDPTAKITVNGSTVASGSASGAIALSVGTNTITTIVTAQDGSTTDTYTITVNRALSAIATLNKLAVSAGTLTPTFASGTTAYTDNVANTITSITVAPTVTDATATIKVNGTTVTSGFASGAITLSVGTNTITTIVTAQDETTTDTYTITVNRAPSAIATLSNLTISSGILTPGFASGTTSYTDNVSNGVTSITVTPTVSDATATIKVNGTTVTSGSASGALALNVGPNPITTKITAQDGTTTDTYTIIVTRASSSVATLNNLTISGGTLSPTFASGTTSYSDNVTNATTSVTVTPTITDPTATIKVNGTTVASGSASGAIALNVGANTITTTVTAQDGTTTDTYTITVNRAASSVATLNNLAISSGTLSPVFATGTTSYTDAVPNAVTSVTVTPTVTDATATIKVNGTTVASGSTSGAIALNVGPNTITTKITAQDGSTTATYSIIVTRAASSVATLSNLAVSGGTLSPVFATNTTAYTNNVANTTTGITVTPTVTDPTAVIKVNGTTVASGAASGTVALNVGTNTITTVVTAQDGTTTDTYTITVNRAASSIATLNKLAISSGTLNPSFVSGITSYTDAVANAITSVTVTPTVTDATAKITVNGSTVSSGSASGAIALNVGANTITTVVTAQDGTTIDTYTITVTRAPSAVSTLSNLTISNGTLSPTFAANTTSYTDNVANAITSVTVTPTVTDATAKITVNGSTVSSGSASGAIALNVGANTITTVVTAQDGTTIDTYTITVNRAPSAVATLSDLSVSSGTLSPTFAAKTTGYIDNVANTITTITVTPTVTDATAQIRVNGTKVASGSASQAIALNVGVNTITTVITAQDGTTTDTYTITVNRAQSSVATLSDLTLSNGTLSPVFAAGTTTYTAVEANATTSITVTPTITDPTATVTVNGTPVLSGTASGAITLNVGQNTITIVVAAQDGTTNTYTTTVTRSPSSNAGLANLTISSGTLAPVFDGATSSYTDNVGNSITSITVTPTVADATSTITVNGLAVTSGSASGAIALNLGDNTITTIITAQDGITTNTYTVVVNRAPSSVATLDNLAISDGTLSPAFSSGTTAYTDNIANSTTTVTVTPTVTDATATITVNGTAVASGSASALLALNVGANTITTVITAQDGTTIDTYTIVVTRASSSNAGLADLTISSGTLSPVFTTGTTNYTASVTNTTSAITVTPVTSDPTSTVTVNGVTVPSGSSSVAIPLVVGVNTITTVVTAQDGTINTYTITVNRAASAIASLANLTISDGTLTPGFSPAIMAYTDNVANSISSVTVTPTTSDATATITVNGITVSSGNTSGAIALNVGSNTITTIITAQDGTTTDTYTIVVNRAAASNADLVNLTISNGTLSPTFASITASYSDAVTNATTSVTVTPTVSDANATITVNGAAVASGTASATITLNVGANTIKTIVTAQDGTTQQIYTITVTRDRGVQTISFNTLTAVTYANPDFDPGATSSSGLPIVYTSSDTTVATIVNGKVHLTGTGTTTITASVADDPNFYPATPVSQPLTVNKADQTISTMDIPVLLTGSKIDLSEFKASSGLPVTFTVSDTTIAVIRDNMLIAKQIGSVTLTVYQPGNDFYNAAETRYTIITVTDAKDDELVVHPVVTPNGDGINDFFLVEGIKTYPDNSVTLANRNGVRVYFARGYDNETLRFDGHSNVTGDFLQAGTYFYLIDYTAYGEHKHKTGFIVLKY